MVSTEALFVDLALISPMLVLFLFSLIPITTKVLRGNVEHRPFVSLLIGLLGIVAAMFLMGIVGGANRTAFNDKLLFDGLSLWMGMIALVSAAAAMIFMYENPGTKGRQFSEYIFLTLNVAIGMLILVTAVDLLLIFIGLEMMSLPLYLMIAMSNEEKLSKESAIKYFLLGSFASAIYLYGVSFVFGTTGTTNVLGFVEKTLILISTSRLFLFGICFVFIGFCFKVSIAPFHAWTPDVYQGAATPITSMMATAVKAVSFAAFLRVIATRSLMGSESLLDLMQWLAVLTMIIGNVAAIIQINLKRMLAYSSISHSGYILVGVIASGISEGSAFGASSVIFYLITYCLMTVGAFAIVAMLEKTESSSIKVEDLSGLAKRRPLLSFCFALFMLSLAGIPPTMGFFGKFYLFSAAINEGLVWLGIWGVINSVISVYYYLRPVVMMYMTEGEADTAKHSLNATLITALVCAFFIIVLGVLSGPLFDRVEKSLF